MVAFWIRELSADSAEGHAQEQSAIAGEAERRRRRLLALLVQSPPADPAVVRSAADEAAWPLPPMLAVIALDARDPRRVAARLGTGAIAARVQELDCAVMADPDAPGRRAEVERAAAGSEGALAAVGPTVTWQDAAESFTRARDALALVREGALEVGDGERRARAGGGALVVAQEHVTELLLARERRLLSDLASDLLAPLASLTPAARRRLSDTLLSWLRHQGRLDPIAADLGIHPQTVRYRLGRARELLGTAVDDPDRRLELELALRARRLEARVVEEARPQPVG